jgi:catechol 2,3-dioxygenase-like lactoylglutathione lyase family enzyme
MLGISDMNRSLEFYRDRLGLKVRFSTPGFAFLDGGGVTLGLSSELAKNAAGTCGAVEVVFAVEDVRAAHAALRERGVEFFREPHPATPTEWVANFRDPDGHLLSIFGPPGNA